MSYKHYLMRRFIPVALANFRLLLKALFKFTEEQNSRAEVVKKGFPNGLPVVDLIDLLPNLEEKIIPYTFLDDTSMITDIALLKGLVKRFNSCDYLEIGSWRGESLMNIVEHTNSCISLSLSNDEMRRYGFSDGQIKLNGYFSKGHSGIKHIGHDSQTFDFSSLNKKFDLIFVDGDHHYNSLVNDTRNVFQLLKNEDSIIIWHDYGNSYETVRWEVLHAILDGMSNSKWKNLYRVSNTFCAIYTTQKVDSIRMEFPSVPNKLFTINITANRI